MTYSTGATVSGLALGSTAIGTTITPSTGNLAFSSGTYSTTNTIQPIENMENNSSQPHQVQVAVFEIERDDKLVVISTKHVDTFWIEQKPKADLKFIVAKKLAKEVDLDKIVIKELNRICF